MVRTTRRGAVTTAIGTALGILLALTLSGAPADATTHATAHTRTASTVSVVDSSTAGPILVAGTAVYTLRPSATGCNAACRRLWPPVLLPHGTTHATAGTGVDASKLGTAKLAKGALQITYAGHRLYWSVKDTSARSVHTKVTTRWGRWSPVTVAANAPTMPAPTTAAPATEAPSAPSATAPPATVAPQTSPPATSPPETAPPVTDAPPTSPPPTPPTTQPKGNPGNGGVGF